MKKFVVSLAILVSVMFCSVLSGCGVVPAAWVKLDMSGYVVYTSNMYSSGGDHIYLYNTKEEAEADRYKAAYLMSIVFYPRILGADILVDGKNTTTIVDISGAYSMQITINKTKSLYDANKKIYLNGVELQPATRDDYDVLLFLYFNNFTLVRGNPGGQANGFINMIKYE